MIEAWLFRNDHSETYTLKIQKQSIYLVPLQEHPEWGENEREMTLCERWRRADRKRVRERRRKGGERKACICLCWLVHDCGGGWDAGRPGVEPKQQALSAVRRAGDKHLGSY